MCACAHETFVFCICHYTAPFSVTLSARNEREITSSCKEISVNEQMHMDGCMLTDFLKALQ